MIFINIKILQTKKMTQYNPPKIKPYYKTMLPQYKINPLSRKTNPKTPIYKRI